MPAPRGEQRDFAKPAPRPAKEFATPRRASNTRSAFDGGGVPRAQAERGGLGAVTIFLIIFVALLVGAGGAGFWAYQEGFINLDAMFGKGTPAVATATATPVVTPDSTGPGNTETAATTTEPSTQLKAVGDRDAGTDGACRDHHRDGCAAGAAVACWRRQDRRAARRRRHTGAEHRGRRPWRRSIRRALPAASRCCSKRRTMAPPAPCRSRAPSTGARATDENGQPTLVGKANIPARNLAVDVLIRKNSDPSLPASHLMEINFTVSDSFVGGSIAGLPGVLLKDEELTQGTPLVGASARVVGNSFLFALSAAPEDSKANVNLLTGRKWIDLALIYASGKRAIITLEKDDKAQKLFSDVFAAWGKTGQRLRLRRPSERRSPNDRRDRQSPRCRRHDGSPARWPIAVCG